MSSGKSTPRSPLRLLDNGSPANGNASRRQQLPPVPDANGAFGGAGTAGVARTSYWCDFLALD
jgi:hypothetical protein